MHPSTADGKVGVAKIRGDSTQVCGEAVRETAVLAVGAAVVFHPLGDAATDRDGGADRNRSVHAHGHGGVHLTVCHVYQSSDSTAPHLGSVGGAQEQHFL